MINSFGTGKPTEADGSGRGTGKRTEAAAAVRAVRLFGRRRLSSPAWPAASGAKPPPQQEPAAFFFLCYCFCGCRLSAAAARAKSTDVLVIVLVGHQRRGLSSHGERRAQRSPHLQRAALQLICLCLLHYLLLVCR